MMHNYKFLNKLSSHSYFFLLVLVSLLLTTSSVGAQGGPPPPAATVVKLNNPLKVTTIEGLLEAILNVAIVLAVPIIVFFIIYAGYLYVTARGNAEQVKQATQALTYAVIGGVIIIGAVAIATIVGNIVKQF